MAPPASAPLSISSVAPLALQSSHTKVPDKKLPSPRAPAGPLYYKLSYMLAQAAHLLPAHWRASSASFSAWLPAAITFPAVFALDSLHSLKLVPAEVMARMRPTLAAGCRVLLALGRLLAGSGAVGGGLLAIRVPWAQLLLHCWCSWVCMVSSTACLPGCAW
jgi:hypothetical protein